MKTGNLCSGKFQLAAVLTVSIFAVATILFAQSAQKQNDADNNPATASQPDARQIQIDLDKATAFNLPRIRKNLTAVSFNTPDGKQGWVMRLPGSRPIATPAYANGMIFVGGGYGSHMFYAIDAATGRVVWKMKTQDDGPTAAVVEDGYVAFNTESCTVIVVNEKTGKVIWQEWLGDPLMSQPAILRGRLFIAYPSGQRNPKNASASNSAMTTVSGYHLLAVELKTGHHLWEQEIPTDVISAPVMKENNVYVTCFDGSTIAFDSSTGRVLWSKKEAATSAPLPIGDQVVFSKKKQSGSSQYEGLARLGAAKGDTKDKDLLASGEADYLAKGEGRSSGLPATAQ